MTGLVDAALRAAIARLKAAGIADPGRDARFLMAESLAVAPDRLTLHTHEPIDAETQAAFTRRIEARARHQPVAQILGRRIFWGRTFEVTGDVLDPRPETETLIACALDGPAPARLLDLGTGSGALLVTLLCEWPGARGEGTDTSAPALDLAARNAARLGVADRAAFQRTNWAEGITGRFDLVVCNPPYIPAADITALAPDVRDWEPHAALTPGPTGLESYRHLAGSLETLLNPAGRAFFEIGASQGAAVCDILCAAGFKAPVIYSDLDGRDRVIGVKLPG